MTNVEAIEILKKLGRIGPHEQYEATCMAIAALEKQEQKKPMTNADRIRAMTDEGLEKFLASGPCPPSRCYRDEFGERYTECPTEERIHGCRDCWLDWLRQEVKE